MQGFWKSMPVQIAAGILLAGVAASLIYGALGRG